MTEIARRREQAEHQKLVTRAHELERDIRTGIKAIRSAWVLVAAYLHEFHEQRAWELLGYDTLNEFLADPEIEMRRRTFFNLVQIHEELVVIRGVQSIALEGIDYSKVAIVLPSIKTDDVSIEKALDDARELGQRDLRAEYNGDRPPGSPLDGSAEPERLQCPTCRSWVEADKLEAA